MSRPRPVRLPGALALVTGAGSGIGRATALALAGCGSRVVCTDVDGPAAGATAEACAAFGPRCEAHAVDVTDRAAVQALADDLGDRLGPPDVLVNNAGIGMSGHFLDMGPDDWDRILQVNLLGAVHHCRAFGPAMVARGSGQVVNVASGLAYTPTASEPGYVTAKAALLALSRCLRADWHRHGVGVSAVCPGVVDTAIVREHTTFLGERADPESVAAIEDLFRRRGHPPQLVADAVLRAVRGNRSVVPVGAESWAGWLLSRLAPVAVGDRLARLGHQA